jgi:serine/threonine protein kinase
LEGRYRTIKLLGQGGFGKTYQVNDIHSHNPRVLKVLINNQPKAVELFQREAEVLRMLEHPGIPKVEKDDYFIYFSRASQQPLHCLVMEKIEGMDLYEYMQKRENRPIKEKLAVQWLKEIVNILQLVHDKNFFHRDIKPPNIMLRATGRLALIDFGAVREATQTYYFAHQQGNVTGLISIGYTPGEQMNGQALPQSDFFALGRTFVFLLTGKEPLDPAIYNSYNDTMHWRDVVPDISPKFADLIDRMMERLPSQRPTDTRDILQTLAEIEQAVNPARVSSPPSLNQPFPPTVQSPPLKPEKSTQKNTLYSTTPQPDIGEKFWAWWILAHFVGFATLGILLPITQWLVLRKWVTYESKTGWWVLVTAIGTVVIIFSLASARFAGSLAFTIFSSVSFSLMGTLQWLLLRRWVSHAAWWILANAMVGLVISIITIAWAFLTTGSFNTFLTISPVPVLFYIIAYSLITGFAFIRLLRNPISNP